MLGTPWNASLPVVIQTWLLRSRANQPCLGWLLVRGGMLVPEKVKGRDLLTPRNGHRHALHGTLSSTPEWACLETPSMKSKLPVSLRTAAEARENRMCGVCYLMRVLRTRQAYRTGAGGFNGFSGVGFFRLSGLGRFGGTLSQGGGATLRWMAHRRFQIADEGRRTPPASQPKRDLECRPPER